MPVVQTDMNTQTQPQVQTQPQQAPVESTTVQMSIGEAKEKQVAMPSAQSLADPAQAQTLASTLAVSTAQQAAAQAVTGAAAPATTPTQASATPHPIRQQHQSNGKFASGNTYRRQKKTPIEQLRLETDPGKLRAIRRRFYNLVNEEALRLHLTTGDVFVGLHVTPVKARPTLQPEHLAQMAEAPLKQLEVILTGQLLQGLPQVQDNRKLSDRKKSSTISAKMKLVLGRGQVGWSDASKRPADFPSALWKPLAELKDDDHSTRKEKLDRILEWIKEREPVRPVPNATATAAANNATAPANINAAFAAAVDAAARLSGSGTPLSDASVASAAQQMLQQQIAQAQQQVAQQQQQQAQQQGAAPGLGAKRRKRKKPSGNSPPELPVSSSPPPLPTLFAQNTAGTSNAANTASVPANSYPGAPMPVTSMSSPSLRAAAVAAMRPNNNPLAGARSPAAAAQARVAAANVQYQAVAQQPQQPKPTNPATSSAAAAQVASAFSARGGISPNTPSSTAMAYANAAAQAQAASQANK